METLMIEGAQLDMLKRENGVLKDKIKALEGQIEEMKERQGQFEKIIDEQKSKDQLIKALTTQISQQAQQHQEQQVQIQNITSLLNKSLAQLKLEKRRAKQSEDRSGQLDTLLKKMQLEISQYRAFVDGTCEQLFFDDPDMQKKAQ